MIVDQKRFNEILESYHCLGLKVALDDFGAGYAGLNLLAGFHPDMVKLNMNLVRGIERQYSRQAIVLAISHICHDLDIDLIAEGVETMEEYVWLNYIGVYLFQGYLFAAPKFESLVEWNKFKMGLPFFSSL